MSDDPSATAFSLSGPLSRRHLDAWDEEGGMRLYLNDALGRQPLEDAIMAALDFVPGTETDVEEAGTVRITVEVLRAPDATALAAEREAKRQAQEEVGRRWRAEHPEEAKCNDVFLHLMTEMNRLMLSLEAASLPVLSPLRNRFPRVLGVDPAGGDDRTIISVKGVDASLIYEEMADALNTPGAISWRQLDDGRWELDQAPEVVTIDSETLVGMLHLQGQRRIDGLVFAEGAEDSLFQEGAQITFSGAHRSARYVVTEVLTVRPAVKLARLWLRE